MWLGATLVTACYGLIWVQVVELLNPGVAALVLVGRATVISVVAARFTVSRELR